MIISYIIIGLIFIVLVFIASGIIVKNNGNFKNGCASCPYRDRCKNK